MHIYDEQCVDECVDESKVAGAVCTKKVKIWQKTNKGYSLHFFIYMHHKRLNVLIVYTKSITHNIALFTLSNSIQISKRSPSPK